MQIEQRTEGDVTVLKGSGKLTIGRGDVAFRDAVHSAVRSGCTKVVFDMSGVSRVDSAGVGELVAQHVSLAHKGGGLRLLHLSDRVGGVLKATRLTGVLEVFDDEPAAMASFG